jgi:hypothetical protein
MCTSQIYNDVWFSFTAPCYGWYTVDTCATLDFSFDTMIAVYAQAPFHTMEGCGGACIFCIPDSNLAIACNDDSACGIKSAVTFQGNAGHEYFVRVGSYYSWQTGTGALTLSGPGCGLPHVEITDPAPFDTGCNPITITGTAESLSVAFAGYVLEYSANPQGPWVLIASQISPVVNGTLGVWNTTGVPEGHKFLRLTAADTLGYQASFTTIVYVDQAFNGVGIRSPLNGAIVGGIVCPDGSIDDYSFVSYRVEYAGPPFSTFNPVDPGTPVYNSPVINDPLAHWNTVSGGAAVSDGDYRLRFTGTDACGHTATVSRDVVVDNTPPVAVIASPMSCTNVNGIVTITGTVTDAHLSGWSVQVIGAGSHTWTTIGSGSGPVVSGTLATWNTSSLSPCPYAIRLIASDAASINCDDDSNRTEYGIVVNVGCPADFNRSGAVNSQDYFDFLAAFFSVCP